MTPKCVSFATTVRSFIPQSFSIIPSPSHFASCFWSWKPHFDVSLSLTKTPKGDFLFFSLKFWVFWGDFLGILYIFAKNPTHPSPPNQRPSSAPRTLASAKSMETSASLAPCRRWHKSPCRVRKSQASCDGEKGKKKHVF